MKINILIIALVISCSFYANADSKPFQSIDDQSIKKQPTEKQSTKRPNIIVMLSDNLGFGDLGVYGGGALRGAPTPNIDELANQGIRFTNFTVEAECTPSRSALMTGRLPVRSGTGRAMPVPGLPQGLAPWEVTIAEVLEESGYSTAMFGKWHLGYTQERLPTAQGFEQWWGFPFSTYISKFPEMVGYEHSGLKPATLWQGTSKEGATPQEEYNTQVRPLIDDKIATKSIEFIKRNAHSEQPFFLYIPWSLPHHPSIPHPDFEGKTGNGKYADVIVEHDHRVGQVLKAIDEAGISDNTIIIYASDNGPDRAEYPWVGDTGPFRGYLGTVHEGSVRTPLIVRWPNKIKANHVTNEMIAMVDLFPTMANMAQAADEMPDDRPMDGKDMTDFILGKTDKSPRDSVLLFSGEELMAIKWRQFKIYFQGEHVGVMDRQRDSLWAPEVYNTMVDPKEADNIATANLWVLYPAFHTLMPFIYSVQQDGLIEPGGDEPSRYKIDVPFFRWEQIEDGLYELKKKAIKKKITDAYEGAKSLFVDEKATGDKAIDDKVMGDENE